MGFDWGKYILLAEELVNGAPDDAKLRSSTSRAYYGSFIPCRNYKGYNISTPNIHQLVIELFQTSEVRDESKIGNHLSTLRKHRNDADYNGLFVPSVKDTKAHIQIAKTILNLLENIRSND